MQKADLAVGRGQIQLRRGKQEWGVSADGFKISFGVMRALKLDSDDDCTALHL